MATADPSRAKAFYRDRLGLSLVGEDSSALVLDANGTWLRIAIVKEGMAPPYTVLGWAVHDIEAVVKGLLSAGVKFEYYPQFMTQDELGIWTAPGGTRLAWFKDPDGNTLSISQH